MSFIPDTYISNEFQKLDIYKRIAGIESQQEYDDMLEELIDRFGGAAESSAESAGYCKTESTGTSGLHYGNQADAA